MNTRERIECMGRFVKSVDNMTIKTPTLIKMKEKYMEELTKGGKVMKIYGDVEEVEAIIYGHYEVDIDKEDFEECSEKDIKYILISEGKYVIDDIDMIYPRKIVDIDYE